MSRLSFLVIAILLILLQSVFAGPNPNREFSVDRTEIFTGVLVTFDASNIKPAKKFIWSLGNGETVTSTHPVLSYQYTRAGTYTASLTYQVNASEKNPNYKSAGSVVITVKDATPKPNIAPTANISCSVNYQLVSCSALASYDPENQPLTYTFDYEDGFTETNTTGLSGHAYASPGLFNVRLSVFDSAGASGVASIQVQAVKPPNKLPVLALNCSSSQINTLTCDAVGSADSDGSIYSYSYAWGDGESESKADASAVTHRFSSSGAHSITLTAVDNEGGVSSITKSFEVKANTNPMASFDCDASKPLKLVCTSTSTDADAEDAIQSYSWKFGANTAYSTATTTTDYSFQSGGEIAVTLEVKDSFGGTNSLTKMFTVKDNQLPNFDFRADVLRGIAPLKVHFQVENIVDTDGTIASTEINFGDETISGASDVFHTFQNPGTYNVVATITDDLGGTTTKTIQIVAEALIENPPQAFFKIFQFETKVELHATLTKTQYEIKKAFYTIDGSETVELIEFYPNTVNWVDLKNYGHHDIKLTVEDIYGQQSSFTHSFDLIADLNFLKPYVDFTFKQSAIRSIFINLNRSFDFDIDQPITSFQIDFGDGSSTTTSDLYATHTYLSAGSYSVVVTAISSHNTQSSITKIVTVTNDDTPIQAPIANFGYRIYDFAQNVSFYNDRSGTPNGEIISYIWEFGDGSSGTGQKVSHFYSPGSYLVKLTVVDSAGLTSTQVQHITIYAVGSDLIAEIDCSLEDPFFEIIQQCQLVALDKLNQISRVRVVWGDGTANNLLLASPNGIYKPSHKFSAPGNYNISLVVSTTRGEVKTTSFIRGLTEFTPSIPNAVISCEQNLLEVSCSSLQSFDPKYRTLSFTFDWGDGSTETTFESNATHAYKVEGSYDVKLTATNSAGYSGFTTQKVDVYSSTIRPSLSCEANNLLVSCNTLGTLDYSGNGPLTFKFIYEDGFEEVTNNFISSHAFSYPGLVTVVLEVSNSQGDTARVSTQVQTVAPVNMPPIAKLNCSSSLPQTLTCDALQSFDEDGTIFSYTYIWDDGERETFAGPEGHVHFFESAGTHKVELIITDNDGGQSNVVRNFEVPVNQAPLSNFECATNLPQRIDCISIATEQDSGDEIVNSRWEIWRNGNLEYFEEGLFNLRIEKTFAFSGQIEVRLEVEDKLGAKSVSKKTFQLLENQAPVVQLECNLSEVNHVNCFASISDKDGYISKTEFFIDNILVATGTSLEHLFSNGGSHEITFKAVDNLGKESSVSKNVMIDLPEISFQCTEEKPMIVQCLNTKFVSNEEDPIIKYYFAFDDADVLPDKNVEYEFYSFGKHKITFVAETMSGRVSTLTTYFQIDPKYLSPRPEFIHEVELNKSVHFDASFSRQVGRKVVKYEWKIGNSEYFVGQEVFDYHFDSFGWHSVSLKITDEKNISVEESTNIFVYNPEVPYPDETSYSDIFGVDSDNNDVRDDVQIWINKVSFDSEVARQALKDLAKIYKHQFLNLNNYELLLSLERSKHPLIEKIDGELLKGNGISKSQEFIMVYFNSNERVEKYSQLRDALTKAEAEEP